MRMDIQSARQKYVGPLEIEPKRELNLTRRAEADGPADRAA